MARKALPKIVQEAGITIERRIAGYAYAQSGNAHNPTPRYIWIVWQSGTKNLGSYHSYKAAVELAEMYARDPR